MVSKKKFISFAKYTEYFEYFIHFTLSIYLINLMIENISITKACFLLKKHTRHKMKNTESCPRPNRIFPKFVSRLEEPQIWFTVTRAN